MSRDLIIRDDGEPSILVGRAQVMNILEQIRPKWKQSRLIGRVMELLRVDPSSACQKVLNAAFQDLKEKVIVMGVDIAKATAVEWKLPSIEREEDILEYNVSKTIELAYRIGLLTRPEYRRIKICYEIRRNLEHEDDEYEATPEDCLYIFNATIEIILSKDPASLLKVTDIKELVEQSGNVHIPSDYLEDYERTPALRQKEIMLYLVSTARNQNVPDIVRENSFEALKLLSKKTFDVVTMEIAKELEKSLGRSPIDFTIAKLGYASKSLPYFKTAKTKDFFQAILDKIDEAKGNYGGEGQIAKKLEAVGGLSFCPPDLLHPILKRLVLIYIGEPGGYGMGANREVFFSNLAAPIIERIIKHSPYDVSGVLENLENDKAVAYAIGRRDAIRRRFKVLIQLASPYDSEE